MVELQAHPAYRFRWRLALILFLLGFFVRLAPVVIQRRYEDIEKPEIFQIGEQLAKTGQFANPFFYPTGPTAMCAPGYPFLLALIFRIMGFGVAAQVVITCLACACASAQFALLPWLAAELRFSSRAGILAGIAGAVFPFWFWIETKGSYETTEATLLFVLALAVTAHYSNGDRHWPAWYGLLWGVVLLVNPAFVTVLAALCLLRFIQKRSASIREIALTAALAILVLIPWTVRNYVQFRHLFFIRDNFGLELSLSNSPRSHALFDDNGGPSGPYALDPNFNAAERARLVKMGEFNYFAAKKQEAFSWARAHRMRFLELCAQRVFFFWFPRLNATWKTALLAIVTLLGGAGFLLTARRDPLAAAILGSALLVYPLPYYLVQVDVRYRYPLYSLLLLCAMVFADRFLASRRDSLSPRSASAAE